jgi:hypothetical protein
MAAPSGAGRGRLRWLLRLGLIGSVLLIANLPVTTRQGVNHQITEHRLPLYLKTFEFLDRNAQYGQLAGEITRDATSDRARLMAVFAWTARRIQPIPAGWPVVDDHILNIVIRGYGAPDQRADVCATLLTYAGVPAFWEKVKAPGTEDGVILTFARVDGRWVVMDVANGFVFQTKAGELATAEDLAADRALLPEAAGSLTVGSTPYSRIFTRLRTPPIPRPLRAELQMPWPRLRDEARRAVGRD